ncbi:MAG: secondary thiamine-phosphate synthase enzyme YjbQ [Halolamina sp.]
MERLRVETDARLTTVDVTDRVEAAVPADSDGLCTVVSRHTTAGVVVQEDEPRLREDIERALADRVDDEGWRHDALDGNADGHLRATLVGESASLPVRDGELDGGRWQSVLFVECDGPRSRELDVVVTPTVE